MRQHDMPPIEGLGLDSSPVRISTSSEALAHSDYHFDQQAVLTVLRKFSNGDLSSLGDHEIVATLYGHHRSSTQLDESGKTYHFLPVLGSAEPIDPDQPRRASYITRDALNYKAVSYLFNIATTASTAEPVVEIPGRRGLPGYLSILTRNTLARIQGPSVTAYYSQKDEKAIEKAISQRRAWLEDTAAYTDIVVKRDKSQPVHEAHFTE